jgi:hypothetical protein
MTSSYPSLCGCLPLVMQFPGALMFLCMRRWWIRAWFRVQADLGGRDRLIEPILGDFEEVTGALGWAEDVLGGVEGVLGGETGTISY